MSWFKAVAPAAVVAILAGACGFSPLYGTNKNVPASAEMALIDVKPIKDRAGQEMRNRLLDLLTPKGRPATPRYSLKVELTESIEELAVQQTAFSTRANLTVNASFVIRDLRSQGQKIAMSGGATTIASYDILNSAFAFSNHAAETDARSRATADLAEEIRTRIALWLKDR